MNSTNNNMSWVLPGLSEAFVALGEPPIIEIPNSNIPTKRTTKTSKSEIQDKTPFFKFPCDRIQLGIVKSLSNKENQHKYDIDMDTVHLGEFSYEGQRLKDKITYNIYLYPRRFNRYNENAKNEKDIYKTRFGAITVKVYFALFKYLFNKTNKDQKEYFSIIVSDICKQINLKPHQHRGFRAEDRKMVTEALFTLLCLGISGYYRKPNHDSSEMKISQINASRIWKAKGSIYEELDFCAGDYFYQDDWKLYNNYYGEMPEAFFTLHHIKDEWAILLGANIFILSKIQGYKTKVFKVDSLISASGLDVSQLYPKQIKDRLEEAFNKLKNNSLVESWSWLNFEPKDRITKGDIYKARIEIIWNPELVKRGAELAKEQKSHIKKNIGRKENRMKSTNPFLKYKNTQNTVSVKKTIQDSPHIIEHDFDDDEYVEKYKQSLIS